MLVGMWKAALRPLASRLASGVDVAVTAAVLARSKSSRARSRAESLGHEERMVALQHIAALYGDEELYRESSRFFPAPAQVLPASTFVRALPGGEVVDLTWPSGYQPFCGELNERYQGHRRNQRVFARVVGSTPPARTAVILVHGYLGGHFAIEERSWPIEAMRRRGPAGAGVLRRWSRGARRGAWRASPRARWG
jgi:hypothetical protein